MKVWEFSILLGYRRASALEAELGQSRAERFEEMMESIGFERFDSVGRDFALAEIIEIWQRTDESYLVVFNWSDAWFMFSCHEEPSLMELLAKLAPVAAAITATAPLEDKVIQRDIENDAARRRVAG